MNHMLSVIQKAGIINKFELQDLCGMSIFSYNQISAKFLHRYQDQLHQIEYDRKSKSFKWIEQIRVDEKLH